VMSSHGGLWYNFTKMCQSHSCPRSTLTASNMCTCLNFLGERRVSGREYYQHVCFSANRADAMFKFPVIASCPLIQPAEAGATFHQVHLHVNHRNRGIWRTAVLMPLLCCSCSSFRRSDIAAVAEMLPNYTTETSSSFLLCSNQR